jgi:hypothetical protein
MPAVVLLMAAISTMSARAQDVTGAIPSTVGIAKPAEADAALAPLQIPHSTGKSSTWPSRHALKPAPNVLTRARRHPPFRTLVARSQALFRRSGAPPAGERRFVAKEVLIVLPSHYSRQAVEELGRRHRLTRLESHNVELTGTTFHRWKILDKRSVADVIRALEAEGNAAFAQPNYRYSLQ